MNIWLKPASKIVPSFNINTVTITGLIEGNVIYLTLCQLLAPSTIAASKREPSIPINAAINIIADHPISFQASDIRTTQGKVFVFDKKSIGCPPNSLIISLIKPSPGARIAKSIPYIITHDKKWGRYDIVWTIFLKCGFVHSYIVIDKIIDNGSEITNLPME